MHDYDRSKTAAKEETYKIQPQGGKRSGDFKSMEEAVAAAGKILAKKGKGSVQIMYTSPTPEFWHLKLERA